MEGSCLNAKDIDGARKNSKKIQYSTWTIEVKLDKWLIRYSDTIWSSSGACQANTGRIVQMMRANSVLSLACDLVVKSLI